MIHNIEKVHEEMLRRKISIPDNLESFLDTIDEAVRRSGEGMKISGGTDRKYGIGIPSGVRFEQFVNYLHYLEVGEKNYSDFVSMLVGEKLWESWKGVRFAYHYEHSLDSYLRRLFD